ncbi:MAG: FliA/WhiG family RNA polymerase sigma factor [Pontiellaceae bacterium]|nr:FliA/WhiG family RNA polymerase sigma factor [Pontiellaceae bacterium]
MIDFPATKTLDDTEHSKEVLWRAYKGTESVVVDELIEAYFPLVNRVLERIAMRLPSHVVIEDLSQAALLGLYKAIVAFEPDRGVPFEGYAYPRIRGAVLDELRSYDHLSRNKRGKVEQVEEVVSFWMKEHGEAPTEEEIATQLDMSVKDFHLMMDQAKPWCSLDADNSDNLSLHEVIADPNGKSDHEAHQHDVQQLLREGFRHLAQREQKILYLYYFEELRLSEIAQLFDLSEARVSQIHALAVVRLRAALSTAFPTEFVA